MRISTGISVLIVFLQIRIFTQELPVYQQYLLNPGLINPAITSYTGCTSFQITDRHQWLGISDAPVTQTLSVQKGFIGSNNKIHGLGLNMYRDINGSFRQLGADFLYAHHFLASRDKNINISLGLSVSVFQKSINETNFTPVFDPLVSGTRSNEILPEAGAGVLIHNESFFAGLSAVKLFSFIENIQNTEKHFYLHSGLTLQDRNYNIIYKPSLLFKMTESFKKQIDININTVLNDIYWLTLSYRNNINSFPGKSISIISVFGIDFGNFSVAYALDLGLSNIQLYNFGSHEFMIRYEICPEGIRSIDCPTYDGLEDRYRKR
jgi:type IX secretion system PorP/SprF family membrane protein